LEDIAMLPRRVATFAIVVLFCGAVCIETRAAEAVGIRTGAAVVDITPREYPISMLGSFGDRKAQSAHDPLEVRTIVLDDGRTRIAIAVCDNCVIPQELMERAKKLAAQRTQIPTDRMLIAATHTHSAPAVITLSDIPVDSQYTELLVAKIAEAIAEAASRLEPSKIRQAVVPVPEEVFNRRWHMKEGAIQPNPYGVVDKVRMNPPGASADLIRPAGPTDPDVSVLSVQTAQGKPLALLANYSLHYVGGVPGGQVSADYFGEFARQIQRRLAPDSERGQFVAMLSNGTSGDVNNINFRQPRKRAEPFERIRTVAGRVADAAEKAYLQIEHQRSGTLAMAEREISLAVRKPNAEELARAREIVAQSDDSGLSRLARYYAQSSIRLSEFPDTVKVKLQALRIGRLGIVAIPCEVFAEIGLEIKRRSPLPSTFVISLANGYNGYLPTPEQHALGGYETWRATSSYLEVDASRKITSTLLEMLAEVSLEAPVQDSGSAKRSVGMNESVHIVAFGDSITNGVGPAGMTEKDTFRDVVRRELTKKLGTKVEVVNAGVNGDIVTLAAKRLKRDVLDRKPDLVTIMFGGNEAGFYRPETNGFADTPRVTRDEFKAALLKAVDRIQEAEITVVLMTCPPMTERYWGMKLEPYQKNGINFLVKDYAQAMRDVAAEKEVELVDVYRAFQQKPERLDYFPDGLHPDARGHRVIADLLVDRLTRILGR